MRTAHGTTHSTPRGFPGSPPGGGIKPDRPEPGGLPGNPHSNQSQAAGQSWEARRGETAPGGAASSQERKPVTVDRAMAISTGAW
jgi:hypothetical protein